MSKPLYQLVRTSLDSESNLEKVVFDFTAKCIQRVATFDKVIHLNDTFLQYGIDSLAGIELANLIAYQIPEFAPPRVPNGPP